MNEPTTSLGTSGGTGSDTGRAGRREWLGLAALALPTLLVSLDMSVLHLALPHLSSDLHASSTQQLWILDVYGFMVAGLLVSMGTLGDRIGRRRLLLIGAAAFAVVSVVAAYADSAPALIGARALLGIAGSTLLPSTLALISGMFTDTRQRSVAIATWMSCFMVGNAVGPVIGGVLLEWFWWGSVFLLGVPVMLVLLAVGPLVLPEQRHPAGRIDAASVALSLVAILAVVYGLKELARSGAQPVPLLATAGGVAVAVVFVRRQRRLAEPLLDLSLFARRRFGAAVGLSFGAAVLMSGTFLFIPMYLQLVAGLDPLEAGLWLLPQAVAMIASSQAAPHLAARLRPAQVMAGGFVVAAVGAFLLSTVDGPAGLVTVVVGFTLACVGVAPPSVVGTGIIMGSAPPHRAGAASAVSETTGELGIALGLAVMGSIGAAAYRSAMTGADLAGLSGAAATAARESIAGAAAVAGELPPDAAQALLDVARQAFTSGLGIVGAIGATAFVALAAVAVIMFRNDDQPTQHPTHPVEAVPPSPVPASSDPVRA